MGNIPAAAAGRLLVPAGSQEPLAVGGIQLVAGAGAAVRHTTTHKVISGA